MVCAACHRDIKIVARGLCAPCYQRWNKTGTTEYKRLGKHQVCAVSDCGENVVSHGLCDKHRQRLRKHGHINETRPDSWGAKTKHPLYNSWAHARRHRNQLADVWQEDFLQFVADVGERPNPKDKLFAADETKPLGPDNFVWKASVTRKAEGEDLATYHRRFMRVNRALRPEAGQETELKRHYGLSRSAVAKMLTAQNGVCAICGCAETLTIRGKVVSLAVDHSHTGGAIRGLLCRNCNTGIGFFRDSPELLEKAARYLRR